MEYSVLDDTEVRYLLWKNKKKKKGDKIIIMYITIN